MRPTDCRHKEENLEENIINNDKDDEEQSISMCWTKVPGMGLILIIIKNILGGVSDSVAKKIENIGNFLFIHVLHKPIPYPQTL